MNEIIEGDCLEVMKTFPDNHFSAIVTDPPYFLTNNSGYGFMGKSWDSIHDLSEYLWKNKEFVCFAINFLQSVGVENYTEEESTAQENVNTTQQKEERNPQENVKIAEPNSRLRNALKKDFVPLLVITKEEVRELLKELSPNHITLIDQFVNGEKENVKYAIPISFLRKEVNSAARKNVLPSLKVECLEEKETLLTLTDLQRIKSAIAGMIGTKSENQFTNATNGSADTAALTAKESKFNVITLSHIKKEELTQWITSLLCVINAIRSSNTIPNYLINLFFKTVFSEAIRILKPGGYFLAFGGTRSSHKLATAIEQAGFYITDSIYWCYGSGFPKSHNNFGIEGYGTALKPAIEPCILAMKPCDGTFAQNAAKWGQAGINVDGCRVPGSKPSRPQPVFDSPTGKTYEMKCGIGRNGEMSDNSKGRWPANLILDEESGRLLDQQSGISKATKYREGGGYRDYPEKMETDWKIRCKSTYPTVRGDSGGASRFFYCAKASTSERNGSIHPTMKPLRLMEYLIKLVMPPKDGLLLDPFAGSGSTILAAKRLGFSAIGIEKEAEYAEIARSRLNSVENKEREEKQMEMFA